MAENSNNMYFHITDPTFEKVVADIDTVLQKLLKNMMSKGSLEGSVSVKIDVMLTPETIDNFDPSIPGDTRGILIPTINHKIGSVLQVKDEIKGGEVFNGYELVYDPDTGEFIMKPVANTAQTSFYDAQYQPCEDEEAGGPAALPPAAPAALPEASADISDAFGYDYDDPGPDGQ